MNFEFLLVSDRAGHKVLERRQHFSHLSFLNVFLLILESEERGEREKERKKEGQRGREEGREG